jgi:hypothetical protein
MNAENQGNDNGKFRTLRQVTIDSLSGSMIEYFNVDNEKPRREFIEKAVYANIT